MSEAQGMLSEVLAKLEAMGHRAVAVPVGRLEELREHYEDLSSQGLIDERIARELLTGLSLRPPEAVPEPRTLIVVATRDPVVRCTFRWKGCDVRIPVPPTYLRYRRKSEETTRAVAQLLSRQCHVASLNNAPHKLLAVRSGLARYGRNNLTYLPGFGSFYRLTTVCTDVPCDDERWSVSSMMPSCEGCTLCASACPTGAISGDRFLLRGERCLTWWNEKPGDVPFPGWLAGDWHQCLVGCLHCQQACPENAAVLDYQETGPSFTEDETEALLHAGQPGGLPRGLKAKLETWDLLEWLGVLPRNLAVHLPGAGRRPPGQGAEPAGSL
jgi:epoxyqueuosine reductase